MKQAMVDKNPNIASAAIISSLWQGNASPAGTEVVKRWSNEAIEALTSDNVMVQYHALGFLYHVKRSDRLAVSKMVARMIKSPLKSPLATCFLIRMAAMLIDTDKASEQRLLDFLESCLRHQSDMVVFEAANALVNFKQANLKPALTALQHFCASQVSALRFAAVKTLNQISIRFPEAVSLCNSDLESLISDTNRSIATLAITTLLKTGAESSVER